MSLLKVCTNRRFYICNSIVFPFECENIDIKLYCLLKKIMDRWCCRYLVYTDSQRVLLVLFIKCQCKLIVIELIIHLFALSTPKRRNIIIVDRTFSCCFNLSSWTSCHATGRLRSCTCPLVQCQHWKKYQPRAQTLTGNEHKQGHLPRNTALS